MRQVGAGRVAGGVTTDHSGIFATQLDTETHVQKMFFVIVNLFCAADFLFSSKEKNKKDSSKTKCYFLEK